MALEKDTISFQPNTSEFFKSPENSNPNLSNGRSPLQKSAKLKKSSRKNPIRDKPPTPEFCPVSEKISSNLSSRSPSTKSVYSETVGSVKSRKASPRNPIRIRSPPNTIKERKFITAKKNSEKRTAAAAYEDLRASQEEFIRADGLGREPNGLKTKDQAIMTVQPSSEAVECGPLTEKSEIQEPDDFGLPNEVGTLKMKKIRNRLLEEARSSVPDSGSGRVMHLVKAFESILSIPNSAGSEEKEAVEAEENKKGMKWALPGLRVNVDQTEVCSSSFSSSDLCFASKSFDADSGVSSSIDSSNGSIGSRTSGRERRSRRNSSDSGRTSGRKWDKQLKVTSQQPFKLRTEQRGRSKKEEFHKKLEEMVIEEQKLRIPVAQGLPWTTDEPECLVRPPVKEITQPVDLKLHSDLRAMERAEFDNHIAEKSSFIEQYKLERDRQQKWEEEEEIRRLRKVLVPKAQPMPYFDRPFVPKRSVKNPTIPKEPKLHNPQKKMKIKVFSCDGMNSLNEP
ncbi:microtubule-destabilizing protein 60-like isoform X2 [Magnolia sinica]|uniref:microtubule-destabilizing protein 60-like isoform X2 n=1 Tax=Magnolia sinica TaxID=86752 RepID=UPI0026594918|nr:microtubule-destabilizing protein 60-like isoform X2 [Magnolia sinica]